MRWYARHAQEARLMYARSDQQAVQNYGELSTHRLHVQE